MLCKPKPYYDEQRKVSIGYKNPLCLTRAKQVQPALYDGHEIIRTHHVPTIVHNSEDTLEIAEITRKKMNDKMKTPLWTEQNINIRPPDYSKENYLETFTPQTQLTPEQIFWSKDVLKIKAKDLKEQTKAPRPIKPLTVKYDEIEQKNLLLVNVHLIADCLSKEVFYIATNSELTVSRLTEIHDAHTVVQARCLELKAELSKLNDKIQKDDHTELVKRFSNLEVQINEKMKCVTMDSVQPKVLAPGMYAIDVEPIPPRYRNNRDIHLDYLKHLKESVETLREIVEEARVERPLDGSLASACLYTKQSQELLEYAIGTCLKDFNKQDKKHATTPLNRKKQVTFEDQLNSCTDASRSKPRSNTKKNRISSAKSVNKKKVEEYPRTNQSSLKKLNRIDSSISFKCAVVHIFLWYLDTGCSKHMTENRLWLKNFVKKFIGTVKFGNDHFGAIMGYEDYVIGDSVISRVYYVEGLGHNLFSVGKFCSHGSNLYTISVEEMINSSIVCLLSKASKNKSWLWHRRLNHLNFGTINDLFIKDLVRGLPRLKFEKDNLCSACQLGKSKKHTQKPKAENTIMEVLHTLHMDLCRTMRVQSINGKKYILVIVDDYSRFTWVKFLRNRTLVEAAWTMLIFSKASMFLWAEAIAIACYTQNRSLIHTRHNKTPYELVHDKKHDLTFLCIFGALYYPINDSKDLGKLQPTADIGIFVGYAPSKKGCRIYNKRTRRIMETIHVQFDELFEPMAPVQLGTRPVPSLLTPGQNSSGVVPNPVLAVPYVPSTNKELKILFQPMFDEYLEPPRVERPVPLASAVHVPVNSASTPSSTTIDQDAPSTSHSPSFSALQSMHSHQGVAAGSTIIEDNPFAHAGNDPFINVFALEPSSEASSSGDVSSAESIHVTQPHHHLGK
ncbi:retrovirus-related pol polyprotein from transposon TNT 1-94 [Tanacetum coccineum]